MGMKADGVLYLAAEFIDTFNEINKQVHKGAVEVAKNNQIKLSVDEKSISDSIEKMLKSKKLEGFDLSDMITPALQKASNQNLSKEDRVRALKGLEDNIFTLSRAPLKTLKNLKGANSKDITAAVQNINQDMLDNPIKWANVSPSKEIGRMLSEQLSSTVNDIQNQLIEEFGKDTAKYGVDAKTAKAKMEAIYKKAFDEEEGELDVDNLYDDEFSNTSQAMKDFRAYYQRMGKLGEKIPEKFEELFEAISDHLDTLDEDEDTEKAVKDWIESIFTLEDKVIDYANKEASLNKQAADKLEAQKKQAKQDKSSARDRINPIYDDIYDDEIKETKSSISDKSVKKENKIQETKTQQQENKKIIEQANEITATESKTVDIKKQQTQEIEKQNNLLKEQKQIEDKEELEKQKQSFTSQSKTTSVKSKTELLPQDQVQQEIQETASTAQFAAESNKQLAESVQEVTQAVQQEGQAMSNSSIDDYLVKWIEMVRGTKAYSGMEERGVALKGTEEVFPVRSGKLHYERGHVGGGVNVTGFEDKADTLLHSHTYSKEVDNLRFSWADLKTGFDTIAQNMDTAVTKMFLSCGDEIASIDVTGMSSETARLVESQLYEMYNSALILFGGEINNKGVAGKIGISDELMNQATNLMNTMMKGIIEQAGGSVKFLKLADNKLIDNTSARTNFRITPEIANRLKEIQNISNLSVSEASDEEIAQKLRDFQIRNGIKTNTSGLLGLSPEQLEEVDKLLLQIFNHKQQLENAKAGSRMAATIQEKIDEAEKRIAEITKVSNKDIQQQADKKLDEEKVDVVSEKETNNSQKELETVEKIEEVENNITNEKEKQTEEVQKQNDALQQQKENESNIKDQNKDVVDKKEEAIEKTKEELQTQQQLTNELKEQKNIEQTSGETSKEDKKEAELQTIKEIKEETQQVAEQQQKVAEAKQETVQAAQEELKTEQQLSGEIQNQNNIEEQKPVAMLKNKKIVDTPNYGKSQSEIDAQLQAEATKKKKQKSIPTSESFEVEKAAEKAAKADMEAAKREKEIADAQILAKLREKFGVVENKTIQENNQQVEVSIEHMQKLKQGIKETTESLVEYKEINDKINKAQSDKEAFKVSKETVNDMVQAGALSSSVDMAEYIRSAYRLYKKTGKDEHENVLKEALRVYMSSTGKKQYPYYFTDESGQPIKDKNGNYKMEMRWGDAYRDNKYLYQKNGKDIKAYTKDKTFNKYIEQAENERRAYEKSQRRLPTYLEEGQASQQAFAEASLKIQQLLEETGLDAEKINEIITAINSNLTNEEAIWKIINSYIKETAEELVQQESQTENALTNNLVAQQEKNQEAIQGTINKTEELNNTLTEQSTLPVELSETQKTEEHISKPLNIPEVSEPTSDSAEIIQEESNSFKGVKEAADEASKAKINFVSANKNVSKSTKESTPLIEEESAALKDISSKSEVTLKDVIKENAFREKRGIKSSAEKWIDSGIKSDNIERLKNYKQRLSEIEEEISSSNDKNKIAQLNTEYKNLLSTIKILIQELEKADSKENKLLKAQQQQSQINNSLINNRASLANETEKKLNKGYYDSVVSKYNKTLSQYSSAESPEAEKAIEKANEALNRYTTKIAELKQFSTGELQLDYPFEQLIEEIDKAELEVKELTKDIQDNFSKVANSNSITNLQSQIKSILSEYKRISPKGKESLEGILDSLKIGETTTKQLADFRTQIKATLTEEKELGNLNYNIFDRMGGKMQEGIAFLATKFSFYEIFNQFRQGFEVIHQFDDALTEMMKVSDETRLSLERYQKTTFDTADAIGTSALQLQNSTADFMRLGETLDQAAESAKSANVLMNVSEFQSIDEATKSLIAMGAAYDDLSKMNIIDKLNEVGNNYAISTSEAAEALQSSASALKTAGNDMDEALALITAGNAVVQDANKVGTGMRTIALRLTGKAMCPNIE